MECQVNKEEHLRHLLLFCYNSGKSAAVASRFICSVYGDSFIAERTSQKWFQRFKENQFELKDNPRSGRPSITDDDRLEDILRTDQRQTLRELAVQMNCSPQTVSNHLHSLGKVQKFGAWIPHQLTEPNKKHRLNVCASLLARYRRTQQQHRPFLSLIITGDEKWCLYANIKQRKAWVNKGDKAPNRVRPERHPKKLMLCVWWSIEGLIHKEILSKNETITSEKYCQQLGRLYATMKTRRPNHNEVIFHHDNARPHSARLTKKLLDDFGWEVLDHPPYSPDIAASDFYLFRCLQNDLQGIRFDDEKEFGVWIDNWFLKKDKNFFKKGIEKLPERWAQVIENGGGYITE